MVSTVPAEFMLPVAIVCAVVTIVVCISTFLWRYTEHNDKDGLNRESNPMKFKFIGGSMLAAIVTGLLSYAASPVLVAYFKIVEPCASEFAIFGAICALIFGIAFTIIFSEGITAYGKFIEQKVKEVKEVAAKLSPEYQAIIEDYIKMKAAEADKIKAPKE